MQGGVVTRGSLCAVLTAALVFAPTPQAPCLSHLQMPTDDDETYAEGAEHCLLVLSGHTASVCAVCVDERTGARVFSAGADNHVRVWELTKSPEGRVAGARLLHAMSHAAEDARARDLDPSDAWSRLQSMSRGRRAYSRTFSATPRVLSLAVTRDGARCFTGGTDRDLKVWDADAGALRVALAGHETPVGALARFHGDGAASTRVLTGSGDGTVRAWNLARSACEHAVEGHAGAALALAVARDDRRAYSVGAEGDVVGWRVAWTDAGRAEDASALGGLFVLFRVARAHRGAVVRCVAVTPGSGGADQGTLFTGGEDGVARAWRAADWVGGIATCARGKTLCSTSHDGSVIAWRVGKMTRREGVQRAAVQGVVAPRNLADLEGLIRQRVGDILDDLPVGESFNWVEKVSINLTTQMLATIFDFPFEVRHKLPYWSDMATSLPEATGSDGDVDERTAAIFMEDDKEISGDEFFWM